VSLKNVLLVLGLVVVTAIAFAPVTGHPFVRLDDYGYVVDNARVLEGPTAGNLAWAWTAFEMANWHPLTWWSHMLDARIHGTDAGGHHLTNLVLHALNAVLLFAILFRLTAARWRSVVVAALFAVHPLHVETVAWVAERKDVLSTLFGLLAVGAYAAWVRGAGAWRYALALLLFAASLASKPMLVTLPMILLLLDYGVFKRIPSALRRALVEKIPFLALSGVSVGLTLAAQRGAMADVAVIPWSLRLGNAAISYWRYIAKMLWPADLSIFYTYPSLGGWPFVQVACAVIGLVAVSVLVWRSGRRWAVTGWLFYLGTLVPVIGLVQVGRQSMADRYTYVPLIGLFVLAVWGAAALGEKLGDGRPVRAGMAVVGVALVLACTLGTRRQLGYWADSVTLFEHGLEISPDALTLHNNLGIEFAVRKDWDKAERHLVRATQIAPDGPEAYFNLGRVQAGLGRSEDAIASLRRALELYPERAESWFELGILLRRTGRAGDAVAHFREAARLKPGFIAALNQAAWLLATHVDPAVRDPAEALRLAESAARLQRDAATLDTLAAALAANGRFEEAVRTAEEALGSATATGNSRKAAALLERIESYRQERPHVTQR
jgi:Flp pilus assembly protein TadD